MRTRRRRLTLLALPLVIVALAACGAVQPAACDLLDLGGEIQADLDELLALDPSLVAEAGTSEHTEALAAIDSLDATRVEGQAALDETSEEQLGPAIRAAFQAALDATGSAMTNLRTAVESGDPANVTDAMADVQIATDAIATFLATVGSLSVECGETGSSPARSGAASPPTTVAPTATAELTASSSTSASASPSGSPSPSPSLSATPSPTLSPSPSLAASPKPTPSLTPSQTPSPSPSPTAATSPTGSASPTFTASPSPEPSPSAGAEAGDQGPGPLPWLAGLALLAIAAGGVWVWRQSQKDSADEFDPDAGGTPPEAMPPDDMPPDDLPPGSAPPPSEPPATPR